MRVCVLLLASIVSLGTSIDTSNVSQSSLIQIHFVGPILDGVLGSPSESLRRRGSSKGERQGPRSPASSSGSSWRQFLASGPDSPARSSSSQGSGSWMQYLASDTPTVHGSAQPASPSFTSVGSNAHDRPQGLSRPVASTASSAASYAAISGNKRARPASLPESGTREVEIARPWLLPPGERIHHQEATDASKPKRGPGRPVLPVVHVEIPETRSWLQNKNLPVPGHTQQQSKGKDSVSVTRKATRRVTFAPGNQMWKLRKNNRSPPASPPRHSQMVPGAKLPLPRLTKAEKHK